MPPMAQASAPAKVKLICGIITSRAELFGQAAEELSNSFGPIDLRAKMAPFDMTHYYDEQMGRPLQRQFVSFAEPIEADKLVDAKLRTNEIEAAFARRLAQVGQPARAVNLDPGYIEPAKLVLASMKNFSHRIYAGCGVYVEVTLMYRKGKWEPLPWTFPDFASGRYDEFLTDARALLGGAKQEKDKE